jgi:hypothetical protein
VEYIPDDPVEILALFYRLYRILEENEEQYRHHGLSGLALHFIKVHREMLSKRGPRITETIH